MRLATISRTLSLLALPAVFATCALGQDHPNVQPWAVHDQLSTQTPSTTQSQPVSPKAPAPNPSAPPKAPVKAGAQTPAKPKAPEKAGSQTPAKPPAEKAPQEQASVKRRDPFDTLLSRPKPTNGQPDNLPPGKAGLVVGTLRIDGIVHDPEGMIVIVSNPQRRVYFLREGDKLYDGSVEKITLDGVSFHEIGKDAFGKPLERQVTKRLYPSPGEQQ